MESVRLASSEMVHSWAPCCRCAQPHERWDRVLGQPFCPNCEEALIIGESEPLVLRTERRRCAICSQQGTVNFLTFPLNASTPVEMDLCGQHLRALLGRGLRPPAYHQLRRLLTALGVDVGEIFLLHEAFYDSQGHALQPAFEW
jgi:hypothetical protein